ncbi:DUF6678 family protein [Aquimarina rhabdastrellae]
MLDIIKKTILNTGCPIRFNWYYDPDLEVSEWVNSFEFPTKGYIEIPTVGPIKITQWEWLEINSIQKKVIGRLTPVKEVNHSLEVKRSLDEGKIVYKETSGGYKIENPFFKKEI